MVTPFINHFSKRMRFISFLLPLLSITAVSRAVPFILPQDIQAVERSNSTDNSINSNDSPLSTSNTKYISQEPDLTNFESGIFALSSSTQHARAYPLPPQNASDPNQDYKDTAGGTSRRDQLGSDSGLLQWTLKNSNGSIEVPALAPSLVHLDLIRAGILQDPNVGLNEGTARWIIDEPTWTYTADMTPLLDRMKEKGYKESLIYFQGLDTVSTIYIGEKEIGHTDNQFRHWIFNSTEAISSLQGQENQNLTLVFHNPVDYAYSESEKEPYFPDQNTAPDSPAIDIYEYSRRNFIRKQQSDFGWDWGPAYVPRGMHKPAYLIASEPSTSSDEQSSAFRTRASNETATASRVGKSDSIFVYETSVDIYRKGQQNNLPPDQQAPWVVNVSLSLQSTRDFPSPTLSLDFFNTSISSGPLNLSAPIVKGDNDALWAFFEVASNGTEAPELWYPASLGNPKLYDLIIELNPDSLNGLKWSRRTGFRTIVLNQEDYSQEEIDAGFAPGSKFQFEINGKIINTPGSNIIPMDTLYPRVSTDVLEWTISSAMAAGQNLLRIWGGASYQSTQFYDIVSEKGMLAWSEAIFACSMAPTYDSFVENVRQEVLQNVRRAASQPANILWAGNNEGEGFMLTVRDTLKNGSIYEDQYNYMFNEVIRSAVLQSTRAISYIPSSTTHGYTSLEPYVPRYLNKTEGAVYGDLELYQYDPTQAFNVSGYQVGRYVNEFGMHSLPSIYSLDAVLTNKGAFQFNSTEVRVHDKHNPAGSLNYPWPADDGQFQMSAPVELYWGKPIEKKDPRETLAQWAYSTQVHQAAMISNEILFYRLGSGRPERNLGGVYWQLADNWQGSTWSSIEYGGRWKILHYLAARTQDRVVPFPLYQVGNKSLELHVISDDLESATGNAIWTWYDFSGKELTRNSTAFEIKGINTTLIATSALSEMSNTNAWLHCTINGTRSNNATFSQESFFSPIAVKDALLKDPKISIKLMDSQGDSDLTSFEISNNGESVAPWTFLEHPEGVLGWFEDNDTKRPSNAIWLRPGEKRVVNFRPAYDRTDGQWKTGVIARSIWNNNH